MPTLKFWLDDKRTPPSTDWVWYDTAESIISALKNLNGMVQVVSLDHDLGDKLLFGDGYEVVKWIETQVFTNDTFHCPDIRIHSDNPEGRRMMKLAISSIERKLGRRVLCN